MGNVCTTATEDDPPAECPHYHHKLNTQDKPLRTEMNQFIACPICRDQKEKKEGNKVNKFSDVRSQFSLSTQNVEEFSYKGNEKKKHHQNSHKKTIQDFQVVRGLGKGAFGRVYLIKQRQPQKPADTKLDIMSLDIPELQCELNEIPIEITVSQKELVQETKRISHLEKETKQKDHKNSSTIYGEQSSSKNKANLLKTRQSNRHSLQTQKYYALKIINKVTINSEQQKKQAISERYILQAMDHPFIVKLHYAFQTSSRLFLIVDLLPGGQLFYLLRKMRKFDQTLTKFYAAQILLSLQYLHERSIIYRDLKPQNILLDQQGHIKITDFGLSKVMYSSNQKTYSLCGTPQYIAPQVIIGKGYTQAADWFSFGSIIYDMLTGRPPFMNNNKNIMLKNLCTKSVPLPYYLSDSVKSLLNGLFQINPQLRLGFKQGASQIKKHKFFEDIDFQALFHKKLKPPINFMQCNQKQGEQIFLNSGGFQNWNSWQLNMDSLDGRRTKFSKQHFEGFTYANCDFQINEEEETPDGDEVEETPQ